MVGRMAAEGDKKDEASFEQALTQFRALIDADWIEAQQPLGPAAVYTSLVTVWLLVYQRLNAGASLLNTVHELLQTAHHLLPENRRIREKTLSANTGAYSRARQRLKLEVTEGVADQVFSSLMNSFSPSVAGRRAFYLDGTTIALQPSAALKAAFPPASNQHGEGTWPIAHLLVAHEIESGCALLPEIGPKFGPEAASEAALAQALMARLPERSITIADRNFGVFSVAFAARQQGHDALFRLTEQRFRKLRRAAEPLVTDDPHHRSWKLSWRPSRDDRRNNPPWPDDACVETRLHEVRLSDDLTLWLLSTWPCDAREAGALYGRRLDVETDIRDIKVSLRMEHLPARSVSMLRKELAASIIAYNLVVQVRRLAAKQAGVPPRRLSFSGVWSAVRIILLAPSAWTAAKWRERFAQVIRIAGQHKLPHRPGRHYPRRTLVRRNKFTKGKRPPPKK